MKKAPLRKVIIFIFSLILLTIPSMIHAQSEGQITIVPKLLFGVGFTVDPGLMPGVELDKPLFPRDEFTKTVDAITIENDNKERRDDASWNVFKYHNMRISISHTETGEIPMDPNHAQGDKNTKFSQIISLPTTLLNLQNKDSLETVGKIFEPKINLSIEF